MAPPGSGHCLGWPLARGAADRENNEEQQSQAFGPGHLPKSVPETPAHPRRPGQRHCLHLLPWSDSPTQQRVGVCEPFAVGNSTITPSRWTSLQIVRKQRRIPNRAAHSCQAAASTISRTAPEHRYDVAPSRTRSRTPRTLEAHVYNPDRRKTKRTCQDLLETSAVALTSMQLQISSSLPAADEQPPLDPTLLRRLHQQFEPLYHLLPNSSSF